MVVLVVVVELQLKFLICLTWTRFPKGLHVETIETQKVKTCISANVAVEKVKLIQVLCGCRRNDLSRSAKWTRRRGRDGNSRSWSESRCEDQNS